MKISKPSNEPLYWDEGQRGPTFYHWYKKGWWKRVLRKKWIKARIKDAEKE